MKPDIRRKVVVVDEFTGRPVEGRSWSDGLQQAWHAFSGSPFRDAGINLDWGLGLTLLSFG